MLPRPARPLLVALIAAVLAAAGAASGSAQSSDPATAPAPAPVPGQALAAVESCHVASDRVQRFAAFSAQMQPLAQTHTMQIRVDVEERLPGGRYAMVSGGEWRTSQPGVKVFRYLRQVLALDAPADFRGVVHFRWIASSGRVVRHTERRTAPCVEPDPRPALSVQDIAVHPDTAGGAVYTVSLRNGGHGTASGVALVLTVAGAPQTPLAVGDIAAASSAVVRQQAPRCTGGSEISATLDPEHRIDEAPGGGAPLTVSCPLS